MDMVFVLWIYQALNQVYARTWSGGSAGGGHRASDGAHWGCVGDVDGWDNAFWSRLMAMGRLRCSICRKEPNTTTTTKQLGWIEIIFCNGVRSPHTRAPDPSRPETFPTKRQRKVRAVRVCLSNSPQLCCHSTKQNTSHHWSSFTLILNMATLTCQNVQEPVPYSHSFRDSMDRLLCLQRVRAQRWAAQSGVFRVDTCMDRLLCLGLREVCGHWEANSSICLDIFEHCAQWLRLSGRGVCRSARGIRVFVQVGYRLAGASRGCCTASGPTRTSVSQVLSIPLPTITT